MQSISHCVSCIMAYLQDKIISNLNIFLLDNVSLRKGKYSCIIGHRVSHCYVMINVQENSSWPFALNRSKPLHYNRNFYTSSINPPFQFIIMLHKEPLYSITPHYSKALIQKHLKQKTKITESKRLFSMKRNVVQGKD